MNTERKDASKAANAPVSPSGTPEEAEAVIEAEIAPEAPQAPAEEPNMATSKESDNTEASSPGKPKKKSLPKAPTKTGSTPIIPVVTRSSVPKTLPLPKPPIEMNLAGDDNEYVVENGVRMTVTEHKRLMRRQMEELVEKEKQLDQIAEMFAIPDGYLEHEEAIKNENAERAEKVQFWKRVRVIAAISSVVLVTALALMMWGGV